MHVVAFRLHGGRLSVRNRGNLLISLYSCKKFYKEKITRFVDRLVNEKTFIENNFDNHIIIIITIRQKCKTFAGEKVLNLRICCFFLYLNGNCISLCFKLFIGTNNYKTSTMGSGNYQWKHLTFF